MLTNLWISLIAGVLAPLGAVCVLPLYPGFLAYLSNKLKGKVDKKTYILLSLNVTLGIVVSMFIVGLIFSKFLQTSLTNAIGIISPIAFSILGIISIFLLFNKDFSTLLPKANVPINQNPLWSSFLFGLFFGAIVLPCNPGTLTVLFAVSTTTTNFILNLLNFVFFGIGMSLPLILFSVLSSNKSQEVISWLTKHKSAINRITGLIMLSISLYYLIFIFEIFKSLF